MRMSYNETRELIDFVLKGDPKNVRILLHQTLKERGRTEAEFYAGIVEHSPAMGLSSSQWFEILSRLPNRLLRSQLNVSSLLSEEQLRHLPRAFG